MQSQLAYTKVEAIEYIILYHLEHFWATKKHFYIGDYLMESFFREENQEYSEYDLFFVVSISQKKLDFVIEDSRYLGNFSAIFSKAPLIEKYRHFVFPMFLNLISDFAKHID